MLYSAHCFENLYCAQQNIGTNSSLSFTYSALSPGIAPDGFLGDEAQEEHASEGETPSNDSLTEFKQVKMYAQNQIILTKVLNEERDQVCV